MMYLFKGTSCSLKKISNVHKEVKKKIIIPATKDNC